jgi:hypothetical protein
MQQINFKKQVLPHIVAVLGFLLISIAYFSPVLNNQRLNQHDWKVYQAASREYKAVKDSTGEAPLWTNSMFSGMPTYLITTPKSQIVFSKIGYILHFGNWRPVALLFYYLVGFYILLLVFKVNPWLSMGGAAAFGLSSYFFIIIAAGHITKAVAIGYMAPVIAGIYLAYDRRRFWGMMLMAFFLALQVLTNHLQIVYYTGLTALILVIFYLVDAIRNKKFPGFLKTSGVLLGGAVLAVSVSATPLLTTYEYSHYSIRGPSELSTNKENRTTGLDKDYITQWSYGKGETMTLLIPNFKGGASQGSLDTNSDTYRVLKKYVGPQSAESIIQSMPLYFGKQPFTSGPVYIGAFVFFLFVFGLFLVKGKIKWWLLAATILSILLAWGHNMMWFTDLFLEYFPGYNKFRTVSMILVIAEFAMPVLGFLALRELFRESRDDQRVMQALKMSGGLVVGILLIFILAPGISNPETKKDGQLVEQIFSQASNNAQYQQMKQQMMKEYVPAIRADRKAMVRKDALRSLFFVLLGIALVYLIHKRKIKPELAYAMVFLLIMIDMWPVNRRYLNEDNFASKRQVEVPYQKTKADKQILKDNDIHYRVANLQVSLFNDASTSWFHKSIGGYSGAKIRRYQELYDSVMSREVQTARMLANSGLQNQLNPQSMEAMVNGNLNSIAMDMLNTKYIIVHPQLPPVMNYTACGHAWFVPSYKMVESPDEEIVAVRDIDPSKTAVVDERFSEMLDGFKPAFDSTGVIDLIHYHPEMMTYESSCKTEQLAVFPEIYYPEGWHVYVDGEETEHFRVNYVLRAMRVPAGDHTIEFRFEPQSYKTGNAISHTATGIFFLLLIGGLLIEFRKRKNKDAA